jgi:hypothetical protein
MATEDEVQVVLDRVASESRKARRDEFAKAALIAVGANRKKGADYSSIASDAVILADRLIELLDRSKP